MHYYCSIVSVDSAGCIAVHSFQAVRQPVQGNQEKAHARPSCLCSRLHAFWRTDGTSCRAAQRTWFFPVGLGWIALGCKKPTPSVGPLASFLFPILQHCACVGLEIESPPQVQAVPDRGLASTASAQAKVSFAGGSCNESLRVPTSGAVVKCDLFAVRIPLVER